VPARARAAGRARAGGHTRLRRRGFLVARGADPDALDKDGVAPLHRAVRTRSTGAVAALLAAGADASRSAAAVARRRASWRR
jgi:ankyrin repeat protein